MQDKVLAFAIRLATSGLSYQETRIAYFACFLPQVLYGLSLMTHSKASLDTAQRLATSATLAKLGFRRTIHRSIAYGSPFYGGIGLREFYVEQGIAQLQLLIRHLRAESQQGCLLHICIKWAQLQAGVQWPILFHPTIPLPHLPFTWITSVRQFLAFSHCRLQIADPPVPTIPALCRQRDQYIMDVILSLTKCSASQVEKFNRVRIYLQVTLLSEITSADGRFIMVEAWQATRPPHTSSLWPQQPEPMADSIRLWQTILSTAFLPNARTPRSSPNPDTLRLVTPLGRWLPGSDWLQLRWKSFYSASTHMLYWNLASDDLPSSKYSVHRHRQRSRQRNPKFGISPSAEVLSLPAATVPVDMQQHPDYLSFPSIANVYPDPSTTPAIQSPSSPIPFAEYLTQQADWDCHLLCNVQLQNGFSWDEIISKLRDSSQEIIIGSDGGALPPTGSFGAVLATSTDILVEMGGTAFGDTPSSSFRAESYGQLAPLVRLLCHLQTFFAFTIRCRLRFVLDNIGRLARTERFLRQNYVPTPRQCLLNDFDLDMQIRHSLRLLSAATFRSEHVKSHQDTSKPTKKLTWTAIVNIRCDELATRYLQLQQQQASPNVPFLPASVVAVTMEDTTITGHLPHHLHLHCSSTLPHSKSQKSQIDCLCNIHDWTPDLFAQVNWKRFNTATNHTHKPGHQHFCTRWVNHILPVMHRLHKWDLEKSALCPSQCGQVETDNHLLYCTHPDRVTAMAELSPMICDTFNKHHVDPSLRQLLKFFLHFTDPTVEYNVQGILPQYQHLLQAQLQLGKNSLFFGFFHTKWVRLQKSYLQLQSRPHGKNQAETLITTWARLFQSAAHDQWRLRNASLHVDKPSTSAFKHTLLHLRIRELYSQKDDVPEYERNLIFGNVTLDQRLEQTAAQQKAWITSARKTITLATRHAAIPPPGNSDIRSFFTPLPPRGQHQGRPPGPSS